MGATITSGSNPTNKWMMVHQGRRGSTVFFYIDAKLIGTFNSSTDLTNANAVLKIGTGQSAGNQNASQLALFRISASAPSEEQIEKMYNDEKFLFQENAQATLYGISDAVTALAFDDDTNLLHVGTSSGRSVFQGLKRVENTTDAVGSAISASNGMVADE